MRETKKRRGPRGVHGFITTMMHSRRVIPVIIKRRVAELSAENHLLSPADISREIARIHCFLLSDEEVRRILRRRDAFLDAPPGQTIFRLRTAQYPDFERALATWYRDEMKSGTHVGMDGVIAHAKKIGPGLGVADTFRYSHGWCFKFMARHGFRRGWQEEAEGDEEGATMGEDESPAGGTRVQQAQAGSDTHGVTPIGMQQLFSPMQIHVPVSYPGEQQMLALPVGGTSTAGNASTAEAGGEAVGNAGSTDGGEQAHKRRKSHAGAAEGVLAEEGEGDGMHDMQLDLSGGDDERDGELDGEAEGGGGLADHSLGNKDGSHVALLTDEDSGHAAALAADAANADGTSADGGAAAAAASAENQGVDGVTGGTDATAVPLASAGTGTGAAEGAAEAGGGAGEQGDQGGAGGTGAGGGRGRGRGLAASLLGKRGRPKGRPRKHWYPGMVYPGMAMGVGAGMGVGVGMAAGLGAGLHARPPFLGMGIPGLMPAGVPGGRLRMRVPAVGSAGRRGASGSSAAAAGAAGGGGGGGTEQGGGGGQRPGGPLGFPAPEGSRAERLERRHAGLQGA